MNKLQCLKCKFNHKTVMQNENKLWKIIYKKDEEIKKLKEELKATNSILLLKEKKLKDSERKHLSGNNFYDYE